MTLADRARVALRYTFALRGGQLSTFLSSLSMFGLVLAISLLIIVLSVMNGFDKEMRERILGMVPHISLYSQRPISDWREQAAAVARHPDVIEVTPFTEFDALFMRGAGIETARGVGLDVTDRAALSRLLRSLDGEAIDAFVARPDSLVLGVGIADRLGVKPGDEVTLIVPSGGPGRSLQLADAPSRTGPARFASLRLVGELATGTELDEVTALVPLALASDLAGLGSAVSGLRVTTSDLFGVSRIGWELTSALPPGYYASNWMMTHGNLYSAIQLSRNLITFLLLSIIAVAAFNVVSSLVLVVFDKQANIAILRTLGASPGDIASIFVMQGALIGLVGVVLGGALGALGSLLVPDLVAWLEHLLSLRFLSTDVYPVSFLPVDLLLEDVLVVGGVALFMCVLAAVYPARRAAGLAPAVILNQEH